MVLLGIGSMAIANFKPILAVVGFGLTAAHMLFSGIRLRHTDQFPILAACLGGIVLLLVLLLGAWMFHGELRMAARSVGVYAARQPVQKFVSLLLLCGIPVGGMLAAVCVGQRRPFLAGVLVFSLTMALFGAVKIVSYHPVDEILGFRIMSEISIFEALTAMTLIGLNVCLIGCRQDRQAA